MLETLMMTLPPRITGTGKWTLISDQLVGPGQRRFSSLDSYDGKLYLYGGMDPNNRKGDVWVYDPILNTWTQKSTTGALRRSHSAVFVNGKMYVFGGQGGAGALSRFDVYNPATDSWSALPYGPSARYYHACSAIDGKIYIHGGTDGGANKLADFWVYDTVSNDWTQLANGPSGRRYHQSVALGTKLYLYGGETSVNGVAVAVDELWEYDTVLNTWTLYSPGIGKRHSHLLFVINDELYVHAGRDYAGGVWTNYNKFHKGKVTGPWTELDNDPGFKVDHSGAVCNGKLYLYGGTGQAVYQELWEYGFD